MFSSTLQKLINAVIKDGVISDSERAMLYRKAAKEGVDVDELDAFLEKELNKRNGILKLSDTLQKLIDEAIKDGVISDSERAMLYRNAAKEGVDIDELDALLDKKLKEKKCDTTTLEHQETNGASDNQDILVTRRNINTVSKSNPQMRKAILEDGIRMIRDTYFRGLTSLEEIILPNTLSLIDEFAFQGCKSLRSIVIPDSVKIIGSYAFEDCISLESISIPRSVESVREQTFKGCSSLRSIVIPYLFAAIGYLDFFLILCNPEMRNLLHFLWY